MFKLVTREKTLQSYKTVLGNYITLITAAEPANEYNRATHQRY